MVRILGVCQWWIRSAVQNGETKGLIHYNIGSSCLHDTWHLLWESRRPHEFSIEVAKEWEQVAVECGDKNWRLELELVHFFNTTEGSFALQSRWPIDDDKLQLGN